MFETLGVSKVAIFLVVALFVTETQLNLTLRKFSFQEAEPAREIVEKRNPEVFKFFSFGHLPAAIDWAWISVLANPTDGKTKKGEHSRSFYEVDLITDLDPAFFDAYFLGANLLTVLYSDPEGAGRVVNKGIDFLEMEVPNLPASFLREHWVAGWRLYILRAYLDLFEREDLPSAAASFRKAAKIPGAPAYTRNLERKLSVPGGVYDVGLSILNFMISAASTSANLTDPPNPPNPPNPKDERAREKLEGKRFSLSILRYLFFLNSDFRVFVAERYRTKETQKHPEILPELWTKIWKEFLRSKNLKAEDPWGGRLFMNQDGLIDTLTPHEAVFGMTGAEGK